MSEKNIKDYLHFYLGCECIIQTKFNSYHRTILISIHTNGNAQVAHASGNQDYWNTQYIKPILRPLSDMTEEEKVMSGYFTQQGFATPEQIKYLLSKHFDLFGLIEAGLAIKQ